MTPFVRCAVMIGCALAPLVAACSSTSERSEADIRLEVSQQRISIGGDLDGSLDFVATLSNNSLSPLTVEAYRLRGGYVGEGFVFECGEVEQWDAARQEWPLPDGRPMHSDVLASTESYTLAPGTSRAVCSRVFTRAEGAGAARFRFRLWRSFRRDGTSWTSDEFVTELRPAK